MLKRLGKTITNNFSLKILAVILAVVLWVVVINIDDPTTSKTYTTNVVAENTDYITSQNKYYEPLDSSNVVSFRVSAARSVHDELSNADFSATADMENIEYDEEMCIRDSQRVLVNTDGLVGTAHDVQVDGIQGNLG